LESRRVYRGLEEAVLTGTWIPVEHPHSFLSRSLRYRFRETRDMLDINSSIYLSLSNIIGNSHVKMSKAQRMLDEQKDRLFSTIPYIASQTDKKRKRVISGVRLFKKLEKTLTPEMVQREYDRLVTSKKEEVHVLGGKKT